MENKIFMKLLFVFVLLITATISQTLNDLPGVPQQLINQANQALQKATPQLQKFTNKIYNKFTLHRVLKAAINKLLEVKQTLKSTNLILGDNNGVRGKGNIIIGKDNRINGNNNWLISVTDYEGDVSQTLIYKDWEIKMGYADLILINPNLVIRVLNEDEKINYLTFFNKLKNSDKQIGVCDLFWGFSDAQNKLLLTANRLAEVQKNKSQAQIDKFTSENGLLQNGSKYLVFQGLNTQKMLNSLGLTAPAFMIKSQQNKTNNSNQNNQNKSQTNNNAQSTQNGFSFHQLGNFYTSGVDVYNNIEQKITGNSNNQNNTQQNKNANQIKQDNGTFMNRFRYLI